MSKKPHIRWMIRADTQEVLRIDYAGYDEWLEEDDLIQLLRQRNHIGLVVELQDKIVGYYIYGLYKYRLDVIRMAVHPLYLRQGIGTLMIDKLKKKITPTMRSSLVCSVDDSNLAAMMFLKSQGFTASYVGTNDLRFEWVKKEQVKVGDER